MKSFSKKKIKFSEKNMLKVLLCLRPPKVLIRPWEDPECLQTTVAIKRVRNSGCDGSNITYIGTIMVYDLGSDLYEYYYATWKIFYFVWELYVGILLFLSLTRE